MIWFTLQFITTFTDKLTHRSEHIPNNLINTSIHLSLIHIYLLHKNNVRRIIMKIVRYFKLNLIVCVGARNVSPEYFSARSKENIYVGHKLQHVSVLLLIIVSAMEVSITFSTYSKWQYKRLAQRTIKAVSYTHLDVYKRQVWNV